MSIRSLPDVFVGRQPILNSRGRVVAYELLYRSSSECAAADVTDDAAATSRVVSQAFDRLGIRTVVGGCKAFVNLDAELLSSTFVETLPREQVVLEILESVEIDDKLLRRCLALKADGYSFALDDITCWNEKHEPLLNIADLVKIDVLHLDALSLSRLVEQLKLSPAKLLAEKVESPERARQCARLGFDLFQGFFYGRPAILAA